MCANKNSCHKNVAEKGGGEKDLKGKMSNEKNSRIADEWGPDGSIGLEDNTQRKRVALSISIQFPVPMSATTRILVQLAMDLGTSLVPQEALPQSWGSETIHKPTFTRL